MSETALLVPTDATTAPDETTPTCYICYDPNATTLANPLIRSPCKMCNLYIHRACLNHHLIREAIKERCVLMRVDQDGVVVSGHNEDPTQHIVYASCTVCKRRFEYRSRVLVNTLKGMNAYVRSLAAQILSMENQVADEPAAQRTPTSNGASDTTAVLDSVPQEVAAMLGTVGVGSHASDAIHLQLHQFIYEAMEHLTPAEFAAELTRSLCYFRYASVLGVSCALVLVGVTLRAAWG